MDSEQLKTPKMDFALKVYKDKEFYQLGFQVWWPWKFRVPCHLKYCIYCVSAPSLHKQSTDSPIHAFNTPYCHFFQNHDSKLHPSVFTAIISQGRIQRLKKGGAHIEWCWCGQAACRIFSSRTYNTQRSRRVWGHAPLGKFFKFRPYESASEAVRDHYNHAKCLTTEL